MSAQANDAYHELANLITLARANIEAMRDGVLPVSPQRLENVAQALEQAGSCIENLRRAASQ